MFFRLLRFAASPFARAASPARKIIGDRRGVEAMEFALIGPVLLGLLFGLVQFGLTFSSYIILNDSVRVGTRVLAISRLSATPYTDATNAMRNAAVTLTAANLHLTLTVKGTACTSDGACQTALASAAGNDASVTATYPCNLTIMGIDYWPGCTLTASTTERIE
ncbi:MAG: TadE/TadG family type IV pilus assembly protein [Rhodopila sp.]